LGLQDSAMAIMIRCRMPPESLVRISFHPRFGVGMCTAQHLDRLAMRRGGQPSCGVGARSAAALNTVSEVIGS